MMWRMRRRSRTICLSLAFITIFFHLLLALVSFSTYHQPCGIPLLPRAHVLRDLAHTNYTSVVIRDPAGPPTDTIQRDSSYEAAKKTVKSNARLLSDKGLLMKEGKNVSIESDLLKLEALFGHPLYNMPSPPIPEEDWLLRVKPKVKASEKSSQMWVSASQNGYEDVHWNSSSSSHPPWLRFHLGISRWQLYPHRDPNMEPLTQQLATHRIVSAVQKSGGTQLKLVMSFPNYGQAMFKPMKQERDEETNYNLYYFSDFERHNAEIAAFHLDRILGYRRIPPAVGRLVDVVKEIKDITTDRKLARTFFTSPVGNVCFYGQCSYYCSTEHAVCGRSRDLEGSLAVMLPDLSLAGRRTWRSPWRRSYSRSKLAKWETEPDYCSTVKKTPPYNKGTRLVDFIDMVILDFLMEPSCVLAASAAKPLFSLSSILKSVPSDGPSSGADRPHLIAKVGPGIAIGKAKWTEGPRLKASTLIPVRTTQSTAQREKAGSINATACKDKKGATVKVGSKPSESPLTGAEVVQIFVQERDLGDLELYYLKQVDGDAYRPYDLRVVHSSEAGSEHYIFTPNTVLHVTRTGYGGAVSLAEWHREYVLWTDLRKVPFFRDFRLQKAFFWWRKNTRKRIFERRSKSLHDVLLIAVPQFRNALHLLSGVIEELKETHWLPLDVCKSYTLMEFKSALISKNQECLQMLEKLSQCRALILNMAKEVSYKKHQELQLQLKVAKEPDSCCKPIHLLLAHQRKLKKELAQSESTLKKLGNFAALVHQMIIQSLVTAVREDAISFLDALKRREPQQRSLFRTELCFSADNRLTVEPPIHLFKEAVSQALLTVGNSIIQKCDDCGFFLEVSSDVLISAQDLTFDLSDIKPYVNTVETNIDGSISQVVRDTSARWRILPKDAFRMVQVSTARGCYSPFSKTQLEWHIASNDITKEVEKEQAKIMQEVELQIQQLYESHAWMVDMHLFIRQWSRSSLESMKGQPASLYEENIKKVRNWAERISAVDSSVSSSNWLFVIQCTRTKEALGRQLRFIEEEVQEQLVEQIKMESESLISYLESATAELKMEPQDLHDFSKYAFRVRDSLKVLPDVQKRVEYIHSLQNTICMNCRNMTEAELTLEEKLLSLWDCFIPLLKKADSLVSHHLPSMANALDTMFSFLICDLKNVISNSTSGPFLDPGQNAIEMVSKLNYMYMHVNTLSAKLELLSRSSQDMQERTVDLTIVTANVQKLIARKELWELIAVYTTWSEEWKQLLFSEVVVSDAQDKVAEWKEQAQSLTTAVPASDAVLQEILGYLESSSHQLSVLAKLQSPTLKEKHWRAILQDLGLHYKSEKKVTVADLMSQQLESHQKLIDKICRGAQTECDMEQTFHKLCHRWKDRLFRLDVFTPAVWKRCEKQAGLIMREMSTEDVQTGRKQPRDPRFTIDLEVHFAETESSLMMLSTMVKSPYSAEFRLPLDDWIQTLQELEKLLVLLERYQQKWAFLTKMLGGTFISTQRKDLLEHFQPVDETFKEMMTSISKEPHVLNLVSTRTNDRFCGNGLFQVLLDGLSAMEVISNQMSDLLDDLCEQCPRLWFLSEREVMQMLSLHPTPFALQPFVQKCFKGVRLLEVACNRDVNSCEATSECHRQMKVLGFFGSLQEHIAFQSPLEPNADALVWFCDFEKQLKLTIVQLMKQCAVVRNQLEPSSQDLPCNTKARDIQLPSALPVLALLSDYPLQCLLAAEKAVWCSVVLQAIQESSSVKLSSIKAHVCAKLKDLSHYIRDGVTGPKSESRVSKYTMMCLRALLQLTMNHAQQLHRLMEVQCVRESSFEWLSLMKYYINSEEYNDPTCYVDILGRHLQYSFEYCGPGEWEMVHTPSTDQAILGILVALTSYRCGSVSGPSMSGKKNTVIQLGKALGRQVVLKQCYPSTTPRVIQRILLGALQTGAWLVMNAVDLLTHNHLSILGQHLVDIHQSFTRLRRNTNEIKPAGVTGCTNTADSECHIKLAGKSISASLSYGCIVMSSKAHASGIPENLRFATRSIALTHPDYRIMAEVMLSAIGFSEAMCLSQRLVSLISLAQDSHCLPEFFPDNRSCFLVILQKIISASEIHLQQIVRERENSKKSKDSAEEHTDLTSLQNKPMKPFEEDGKKAEKPSKSHRGYLTVVQSLMEEEAIVRAVRSVLLPDTKASQFYTLFKDAFPIACQFPLVQQYIEEDEKNQLEDAVREELQQKQLYCDTDIICSALTLYQTMKSSQAVMLIGPSGSGKTTCYSALAGALNSLAATTVEERDKDSMIKRGSPQAGQKISVSNWSFVDTSVFFPNAMSHDELFGCFCEKRGWQDGALAKVLRDSERREHTCFEICNNEKKTDETLTAKWLVMDGEPAGQPGWLDHLTTLCSSQDAFLCLSSGETLLSQSELKLLMEITDLRDASPSVVTRCSLVYFTGNDLWKCVWKSEMDTLSSDHKLDHRIVKMWNHLGEDLFSSTLSLLEQRILTSAVHTERRACTGPTYGLQEITSFVRILRALLQHLGKEVGKSESLPHIDTRDIRPPAADAQSKQEQLSRNIFLLAYIWGFGGCLHSRHWPQFDLLARQVLLTCRYKVVVPDEVSVFEHFFSFNSEMFSTDTQSTGSVIPRYRKYTYLLNLMLEANQPVLVSGEPGSGKTTLCQTLLSFDKRHVNLPASPLLSSRDLRTILNDIACQKNCKDTAGSMTKQPRLFLFVDDLHEAPCDVVGKASVALETLRQSISKGEILTFDTYNFKLLQSGTISYLATCCISALNNPHSSVISPRLSRLFSVFVVDGVSLDVVISIYSPRLKFWLSEMPLSRHIGEDMSSCIITATNELYRAVSDRFQPSMQRPHTIFSHHDLLKVFQGMCLWKSAISKTGKNEKSQPGFSPASVLNIVQVWMHECMRTFSDRLCSEDDRKTVVSLVAKTAATHYGMKLANEIIGDSQPAGQNPDAVDLPQELNQQNQSRHQLNKPSENYRLHSQILQHMEDTISALAYGPDLSEALKLIKQQRNFKFSSSYQEQDLDALVQKLCVLMDRKEGDKGHDCSITTKYIVHRERVSQLLHILRALLLPRGHGVLIGAERGTGRKTTVRLAAHLTGYQLMEVHAGNENNLREILKEAGNQTISDGVNVIILVHEEISQSVREELLLVMSHSACPALYIDEELRNLVSRVTAVKHSRRYLMDSWMFEKLLSQVHRNVHVFLLMPFTMSESSEIPSKNEAQSWIAQIAKALRHSCCVEVYQTWSNRSLVEVADQCLKASPHKMAQERSEASLSVAMAGVHRSACQYASVLLRAQPFSPRTYMEFITHFGYLCSHLHKQCQDKTNRIAPALARLDALSNIAAQCKEHLISVQKMVAGTQQREKELLQAVEDHKKLFEEASEKCAAEENQLCRLEEQINHAQKQIKPAFLSGLQILMCLDPLDVEEVRHYRDPPVGVVKIMDAVCLLFNHPPGWESAKQLLSQADFFQELKFFNRYILTDEQLQQLGQIVHSPQFVPESVREVSKACESLCRWVQAVYEFCCVQDRVLVKQQLEVQAAERRSRCCLAKQRKQEAYGCLEAVKLQLQCVQNELMEQLVQLHKAESAECEASACVGQLEMYVRDWRAAAQDTELRNQNMPGDALLLAAIISYLGPFGPETRTELLSKWRALCQTGSININPNDPRTSLFTHFDTVPGSPSLGFPIPVTERLQLPLGRALGMNEWQFEDTLLPRLVVKLLLWGYRSTCIQRWPLLADNQPHMEMSFQTRLIARENTKLGEEEDFGMVVCADDLELLHKLDQAAEKGLRVLVTHVERAIPSPQFLAKLARPAGCYFPGLNQPLQMVHPEFCLFLSTHLPIRLLNGGVHPSILAQVHIVDLSLSSEEIQELMLTQLPQPECKELLIQHLQCQNYKQELRDKLATEEDALMDYILQSDTVLLQDPNFLPRVNVCQEEMKKLQDEIKQLSEQLEHHESLLAVPRNLMRLAAAFYQALQAVSCLSPAYYFSLHGFITVMQEAFSGKDRIIGKVPGSIIQEFLNTMVVNLLVQYRPLLFKSHAAVLKLLVSLALLQHNQLCSEGERLAFLRGLGDIEHPGTDSPSTTAVPPSWIPPHIHSDLLCLEKIPSFRGLIASLCASPIQWQEYLHFPSSTVLGTVPCRSHSHLSLMQRALLWKTMVPNCLEGLADAINACQLCLPEKLTGTEAPLIGNPEAFSRYLVKHKRPIILTLPSSDGDMQTSIEPLCLINQLAKCVPGKKEVQVTVLSFGGLCDRKLFHSVLGKAANDGHWLVFNNCHLLKQLDNEIVANLNQLVSSFQENPCLIHPGFRLWFVTQENASHFIPAAVRICALPLVCDSPWDLKEELSCSLRQVAAVTQPQSGVTADNNLLLRCAIFHSVLAQRQTYKYLGQGRIYHWSQKDLHALVDAYIHVASLCHDKTKVLQYLAVSLVYGGHVMDSADLEVVKSIAETCFTTASCCLSSGPHILSKLVRNSGRSDLSGQLQVVEQGLWDSANISEPVVLGFSVDVAAETIKVNSYNTSIFLQTSQTPLGAARCFSTKGKPLATLPAFSHARDRLEGLKRRLTMKNESAVANAGAVPPSPLRDFLRAEWDDLIDLVSLLLSQLQQPVQYSLTYACLLKLTDLSRLERRAELLSAYLGHHSTSDPPGSYRLSAFKNARGLLVALMREAAKVNRKYITDIMLQFEVLSYSTRPVALPLDAVCLCGLELKGASWDTRLRALQDTVSPQSCSMPLLCVKAQVRSTDNSRDTMSCKSSYLMDTGNVQCAGVFPLTTRQVPIYRCPLYLDEGQESGNWGLADDNIITKVPLHSKLDPLLCSLRRVRLVSTL